MMLPRTIHTRLLVALLVLIVAFTLVSVVPASAQVAAATATIHGQVTDESGASLPGVTITLRSPALQVPQMSVVRDERGEYRVTPLPIGMYTSRLRAVRVSDPSPE